MIGHVLKHMGISHGGSCRSRRSCMNEEEEDFVQQQKAGSNYSLAELSQRWSTKKLQVALTNWRYWGSIGWMG